MFRFVGLAWNHADQSTDALARSLANGLAEAGPWRTAIVRPGLQVFVTGARSRVNDAHPLVGVGVVVGRLFRRVDPEHVPTRSLGLSDEEAKHIVETRSEALIHEYWGRYVAFLSLTEGVTRVLRDPSGALPCFVLKHQGISIVFSWLEDVMRYLPSVPPPGTNWQAIEGLALTWELGGRATALDGVTQVLPGEALDLYANGSSATQLIWNGVEIARAPDFVDPVQAARELRSTVRHCARAWASCYDRILLRLSGGVDSSILLSSLTAGACDSDVICVNHHSPGSDSDERHYARLAADRAGRVLIERERDPGFRLERVLDVARMPAPTHYIGGIGSSSLDAELVSTLDAGALFTGVGGDQLLFELARWWPAADHLKLQGWRGFFNAAMNAARLGRVSVWRTMGLALSDRARVARSSRIEQIRSTLVHTDAAHEARHRQASLHPALVPQPDLPIGKLNQTRLLLTPVSCYDPYGRDALGEQVSPLLSQPLLEQCLKLPTYVLTLGGRGRGLARTAFATDLPPEIVARRSKGGINDLAEMVLQQNIDFARAMLLEGQLARRGILDRAKVERVLSDRPTADTTSIAEVHVLIGIEAWIHRQQVPAGCSIRPASNSVK